MFIGNTPTTITDAEVSVVSKVRDLELHWKEKLSHPFALAPLALREVGMSLDVYAKHTKEFDNFCSQFVISALSGMSNEWGRSALSNKVVSVLGPGMGRGLKFVAFANNFLKMRIELLDLSDTALELVDDVLRRMKTPKINESRKIEITGVHPNEISFDSKLVVMSQFLQVLPYYRVQAIMSRMGDHMLANNCRLIIVHPVGNDEAEWGDTIEYSESEILTPLNNALFPARFRVQKLDERHFLYFQRHHYRASLYARIEI